MGHRGEHRITLAWDPNPDAARASDALAVADPPSSGDGS
jgi:hypothetical protein